MSGANQSNRPNTIDIQLINKNLSEKINAIKNTGHIEKISEEIKVMANNITNQDLNTMKVGDVGSTCNIMWRIWNPFVATQP